MGYLICMGVVKAFCIWNYSIFWRVARVTLLQGRHLNYYNIMIIINFLTTYSIFDM